MTRRPGLLILGFLIMEVWVIADVLFTGGHILTALTAWALICTWAYRTSTPRSERAHS